MTPVTKPRSGPSGKTRTHAEQIDAGRRRAVVWLDKDDQRALAEVTERYGSEAEAIRAAVRHEAARVKK